MTWNRGSPGYPVRDLLKALGADQFERLLGDDLVVAFSSFGIPPTSSTACDVLADMGRLDQLLSVPESARVLLAELPLVKAEELLERLGTRPGDNPFTTLHNVLGRLSPDQERSVLSFLGRRVTQDGPDAGRTTGGLARTVEPVFGLFEHQRITAAETEQQLTDSRSVLLHMPTGSGKTRTAMHLICDHLRAHENGLVFWLSEQPEVLNQALGSFAEAWSSLGNRPVDLHRLYGETSISPDELLSGFAVGGFQKLFALQSRDENALLSLGDRVSLVVVDEAHQAIAPTYNSVVRALARKRPTTRLLGLTATPGRTWLDVDEDFRLSTFFESKKVTMRTPDHRGPIRFLVEEGYLARPQFRHVELSTRQPTGGPHDPLDARFLDHKRLLDETLAMLKKHQRIIVFAASVALARLLSAVLRIEGVHAVVVTADTPRHERELSYHRFRSTTQGPMVLVNYGVLTTGFDAPSASGAIIARPTRSLVLFSQMVGRVLRGPRAGGTSEAEIVTTIDTRLPGFGSVAEAFTNWEDVWDA